MPDVDPDRDDREALRRRLYRPDASATDVAAYRSATDAERSEDLHPQQEPLEAGPRGSVRLLVVGGACVAGAALIGGVLLAGAGGPPASAPTSAAAVPSAVGTRQADGSWEIAFSPSAVLDGGRRSGAEGDAVADGPDRYRYAVADGDTVSGIAARFALCRADVIQSLPYGSGEGSLPAGGSLELGHVSGLC